MVISPANSRLGLTALTKRVGLMDRPDSPDGELIKYMVYSTFIPCLSFSPSCLVDYFLHISLLLTHYITFFILVGWPFCDSCQHDTWSIWAIQLRINKGMYNFFHSYMGVFNMTETIMGLNACWLVRSCDLKKPATMRDYGHMPNTYIYNMCQHGKGRINALSLYIKAQQIGSFFQVFIEQMNRMTSIILVWMII